MYLKLVFVLSLVNYVLCINILGLMPVPSRSHHVWNSVLMNELAVRGFNVTVLSCDIEPNTSNLTYIHLNETYKALNSDPNFNLVGHAEETPIQGISSFYVFQYAACQGAFNSDGFRQLLKYPGDFKFDLIVFDFTFGPCLLGFADKFNYPPIIGVTAFNNPPFTHHVIGGHKYYSYIPYYSLNYGTDMNFFQRMINAYISGYDEIFRLYVVAPKIDKLMKTAFQNTLLSNGENFEKLTKLILINSHPTIDFPEPIPPNVVQVGGLQIQKPKPLPNELEIFVNSFESGFVLFSLGTNVRSDELPKPMRQMLLDAMAQFPKYGFLWKFESELDVELPKNVKIQKWLPQGDLLGHPKIRAFITHAGLLSMHEAIYFGVPMVGIPFLADQHRNSYRMVEYGIGAKILFGDVSYATVKNTLKKVLEDPSYRQNIQEVSSKFRDREVEPLNSAVWWIEYILRHPDVKHLESPTLKLGFIRSNLYDIILFLVFLMFGIGILIRKLVNGLINKFKSTTILANDKKYK